MMIACNGEHNVMPIADLKDHAASSKCWCSPIQDDVCDDVFTHNSMDGREAFEDGTRLPS